MKISFWLLLLSVGVFSHQSYAQDASLKYKIPAGRAILPDGKCEASEWRDAAAAEIGKNYKFSFKATKDFVFFCLQPPQEGIFSVDLYLSDRETKLFTFHVSAKLGERVFENGRWKEWTKNWNWWQTTGWTANALRPDDFAKPSFFPSRGIEFQISREIYSGKNWRVMLDVAGGAVVFPANADNLKRETWIELAL